MKRACTVHMPRVSSQRRTVAGLAPMHVAKSSTLSFRCRRSLRMFAPVGRNGLGADFGWPGRDVGFWVALAVDGARTVDGIVDALEERHDAAPVYHTLRSWWRGGFLCEPVQAGPRP